MWTPTALRQHSRAGLRQGSDLIDAEWAILSPLLPAEADCGRQRAWPRREIVNAIGYVLRGCIDWRLMPDSFPPWRTVYRWFARRCDDGTWETINHQLVMRDRERAGREAGPTASATDCQGVKTTEGGDRGYDGGKKIEGRKRHAMVDADGHAIRLQTHAADIQDRDGAGPPAARLTTESAARAARLRRHVLPRPRVAAVSTIRVEIVRKPEGQVRFTVHARRWVVERFFAWINRNRRLAKDFEASIASAEAFLHAASAILLLRRRPR